jgi:hypothetical protein
MARLLAGWARLDDRMEIRSANRDPGSPRHSLAAVIGGTEMSDKTTELRIKDRPQFSELLWDLIDSADVDVIEMIAELDEAISCLMHRGAYHGQ